MEVNCHWLLLKSDLSGLSHRSQTTSMQLSALADRTKLRIHGCCLTTSDQDRLRIFMHEFVVRALIPWAERQMKILNDQVGHFIFLRAYSH